MFAGSEQPVFSIGAVAKMLGVPPSTLRAWEDRYEIVVPHRSEGSQRLYSRLQVEQLQFIQAGLERGMSASDAHRLLQGEIANGRLSGKELDPASSTPLVLIAERDPYAAELAEYLLETEGFEVCIAMDGHQATQLFEDRSPSLVVIDLLISGGAGFRLCREFSTRSDVQVLALSALDSAGEALDAGASAFLQKPIVPLRLVGIVRDLLGTSALTRPRLRTGQLA